MRSAESFRQQLLEAGIVDPDGVHHELVGGRHGQKVDFDLIPTDSEGLYPSWVDNNERKLWERLTGQYLGRVVLIGVANGTNRLASSVEQSMGRGVTAVYTYKDDDDVVRLTPEATEYIKGRRPSVAIALEDVGKSGQTTQPVMLELRELGIPRTEVIHSWQRRESVEYLDAINVPYSSIINHPLPDHPYDDCPYCRQNWVLIARHITNR